MRRLALLLLLVSRLTFSAELVSVSLGDARIVDLVRVVYGELLHEPFMVTRDVTESDARVSLDLRQVQPAQVASALSELARSAGFEVVRRAGVVWVGKASEAAEEVVVYRPAHRSARYLSDVVQGVTGARSVLSRSIRSGDVVTSQGGTMGQGSSPARQGGPTSVEGQTDRTEPDQLAFLVSAKDAGKVRKLLADLDTPSGEVLLKAAVYEVGLSKADGSALQLALKLSGIKASIAGNVLSGASLTFSQGGIEAVLSALDADSRFKSISRPQVRVRNGVQARFSVGQDVPVVGSVQVDRNGNPVSSVEYRQSGVILTATPEIRREVIELSLNQELSNFVQTNTGVNNSPTLIKRSVNTRLGMMPGEVVVLAGLEDEQEDESSSRLPFIGWLVGHEKSRKRSEILVFIEVVRI